MENADFLAYFELFDLGTRLYYRTSKFMANNEGQSQSGCWVGMARFWMKIGPVVPLRK